MRSAGSKRTRTRNKTSDFCEIVGCLLGTTALRSAVVSVFPEKGKGHAGQDKSLWRQECGRCGGTSAALYDNMAEVAM